MQANKKIKILIVNKNDISSGLIRKFLLHSCDYEVVEWHGENSIKEFIKSESIDLLMTFNLEGFELFTLTGGIAYNILDCKQVHFLLDKSLMNEVLLSKQLSIAMFFYCVDAKYRKELLLKYPDIPYLEVLPEWSDNDDLQNKVKSLCVAIEQVIDISRLR